MEKEIYCFHCGDLCKDDSIRIEDKHFCCNGCKTVFEILRDSNLCDYYSLEQNPGIASDKPVNKTKYDFLDNEQLIGNIIDFSNDQIISVTFLIPQMHCSSCIWLLENLYKLNSSIKYSKTHFTKKKLTVKYLKDKITLKEICLILDSIGYAPEFNLDYSKENNISYRNLWYKIGVAGFCFGNIMLLSFPEYLNYNEFDFKDYRSLFGILNFSLSIPVLLYSSSEYYISAFKSLKKKFLNIDFPITIGILAIFIRSTIEVFNQSGQGYFDSLAGLVFFLLIGKLFQNKTYDRLNFERNYKSYFPLGVTIIKNHQETSIPLSELKKGDRILVRNNEIIPADAVLISKQANIDYSFVTGESVLVTKNNGDFIYAGGKHFGNFIELDVIKEVSQSYLTDLWNVAGEEKNKNRLIQNITDKASKNFTFIVIFIAVAAFFYWLPINPLTALDAFSAVLIVACPCALALAAPFTFGNTLRIFGLNKFYLKSINVIEKFNNITHIVFDKTGTLTQVEGSEIIYIGEKLDVNENQSISALTQNSTHPISRKIYTYLNYRESASVEDFKEFPGRGISASVNGVFIKIGSGQFTGANGKFDDPVYQNYTKSFISFDGKVKGYFAIRPNFRYGLNHLITKLKKNYNISVLSGDNDFDSERISEIFGPECEIRFDQKPYDKLEFISHLQNVGHNVLMIGDGLNDAGALLKSDAGITVSENINNFVPACDSILDATHFHQLFNFLKLSRISVKILYTSFIISFIYNIVGLYFAVQGLLSPLIAAILMPVSSISVVLFVVFATNYFSKKMRLL